jgi:hypothetical protein
LRSFSSFFTQLVKGEKEQFRHFYIPAEVEDPETVKKAFFQNLEIHYFGLTGTAGELKKEVSVPI